MRWKKNLEKKSDKKIEKQWKSESNCRMLKKIHLRESQFLFKHRFLTLLLKQSEKISRSKTTRFFAPLLVSACPKSLLQLDFKNHENV